VGLSIGIVLALAVGWVAAGTGLDRDRAFYPVVTIVVASYYSLFAAMGATTHALVLESLLAVVFAAVAIVGFRSTLWIVVVALAGHGFFDLGHREIIANAGVPDWWPGFCLGYDVTAAAFLAIRLATGRIRASAAAP
jgi:hypothetical protein